MHHNPCLTPTPSSLQDANFYSGQALRAFGIGIAVLVAMVETEWPSFLAWAPLLEAWLGRGVLQVGGGGAVGWRCCDGGEAGA